MSKWKIQYSLYAKVNIKEATTYYNTKRKGLGKQFYLDVKKQNTNLKRNPFYSIRYNTIRCLALQKFPYMIHFELNEKESIVLIYAIICTLQNPDEHWIK
jgi:hypothetical protein